jgi:hypothetical protein
MNKQIKEEVCASCGKPVASSAHSCCDFIAKQNNEIVEYSHLIPDMPENGSDLRNLRQSMSRAFLQTQINLEHIVYLDKKNWSENYPICDFIFKTPDRQMLFWMFAQDPIGEGFSPKTAAQYLQRDRTSVSKELTTMHDLKLIYRNPKEGFQRYYLPSKKLVDSALWFAEYYVDMTLRVTEEPARDRFFKYREAEQSFFKDLKKRGRDAQ